MIHQYPSAFISSTFLDLRTERKTVTDLFKRLNIIPQALDTQPASNNSSKSEIIKGIQQSDFVVLIVGGRYGTINNSFTDSNAISITQWEYNLALKYNKPIIAMIKNNPTETDNNEEKSAKLELFKKILTHRHSPQYFDNSDELFEKVLHSIIPSYRNSLSKNQSAISSLQNENESLKKEVELLRSKTSGNPAVHSGLGLSTANNTNTPKLSDLLAGNYGTPEATGLGLINAAMLGSQQKR